MEKNIVYTKDYLLLIDEEAEIKKGDYLLEKESIINIFPDYLTDIDECDKIIAYYPLTKEVKELELGLPLLPPFKGEADIEELADSYVLKEYFTQAPVSSLEINEFNELRDSFIEGYKAAQSSNKQYSLEDMKKAIRDSAYTIDPQLLGTDEYSIEENRIIQSLSTQQFPTSVELTEDFKIINWHYGR